MKKLSYFLLFLLSGILIFGCTNEQSPEIDLSENNDACYSQIRTKAEAVSIAKSIFSKSFASTRGTLNISTNDVTVITSSKTRADESDTVLYAVDFKDGGFTLVAANRELPAVLAFTEEGSFNSFETKQNENFQYVLEQTIEYASSAPGFEIVKPTLPFEPYPVFDKDTTITITKTDPLVTVSWNQYWPENIYCPNKIAGCVPVATAQIMSAMEKPAYLDYTFAEKDILNEAINWKDLKHHNKSTKWMSPGETNISNHLSNCNLGLQGHKTLARITREIGNRTNANYKISSTSANFPMAVSLIERLTNKSTVANGSDSEDLYNSLSSNTNRLAIVVGYNPTSSGHCWVADASCKVTMVLEYWAPVVKGDPNANEDGLIRVQDTTINKYIHYNWGWNGNCNGYFLIDIFNPAQGWEYDNPNENNSSSDDYSEYFHYYVFSIM